MFKSLASILTISLIVSSIAAADDSHLKIFKDYTGRVTNIQNLDARKLQPRNLHSVNKKAKSDFSKADAEKEAIRFLSKVKKYFGIIKIEKELHASAFEKDQAGMSLVRHEQIYNGIKVFGGGLVTRLNQDGVATGVNGNIVENIDLDVIPKITQIKAEGIARKAMADKYGWKTDRATYKKGAAKQCRNWYGGIDGDNIPKCVRKNIARFRRANNFITPASDLMVFNSALYRGESEGESVLAWRVGVKDGGVNAEEIFINAENGEIVERSEHGHNFTERWIFDCSNPKGDNLCYSRLGPDASPPYLDYAPYTFGRREGAPVRGPNPLPSPNASSGSMDVDTIYATVGGSSDDVNAKTLLNFYKNKFGRDGANGLGGGGEGICDTTSTICPGIVGAGVPLTQFRALSNLNGIDLGLSKFCSPGNAQFTSYPIDNATIKFCRGSATPDIIAHEFSHMIPWFNNYEDPGVYNPVMQGGFQSGALNEAFADIMAIAFKYYAQNEIGWIDWSIGNDSNLNVRVLSNPSEQEYKDVDGLFKNYPDHFYSPDVRCSSDDNGGMHVNASIPAYAAYLAAEGGNFNGCHINGIGLQKVIRIWYRAVTNHFVFNMSFNDAANSIYDACIVLSENHTIFPDVDINMYNCLEMKKAMQAVEMDQPGICSGIPRVTPECAIIYPPPPPPLKKGDFNYDSQVNLWDWNVLRREWGKTGNNLDSDANHDGTVDIGDYNIWLANYVPQGTTPTPPHPTLPGDYNFDGVVANDDWLAWKNQYSQTGPALGGDGNVDGSVDAADYTVWRDNLGSHLF